MQRVLILLGFLNFSSIIWGSNNSITGFVQDEQTGERLVGATVFIEELNIGCATNNFGYFKLIVPDSISIKLEISFIGYKRKMVEITPEPKLLTIISLVPYEHEVGEVVVVSHLSKIHITNGDFIDIPLGDLSSMPALLGERDLIKSLLAMPGVQFSTEGTANISIRGGAPEQNLILVDDVPVYNPNHLLGIFSPYNTDALKSASLLKGSFPARYGGRTSSVLDLRMKEGNSKSFHGTASLGILSVRMMLEGPIIKNKMSFLITGRRSFIDLLALPITSLMQPKNDKINYRLFFYDITGKLNYNFSNRDKVYASVFISRDPFTITGKSKKETEFVFSKETHKWTLHLTNQVGSFRWNHIFNDGAFSNTTLYYSKYDFSNTEFYENMIEVNNEKNKEGHSLNLSSGLTDLGAKTDFEFNPNNIHKINAGLELINHNFQPGIEVYNLNDLASTYNIDSSKIQDKRQSIESALYMQDEIKLGDRFSMNIGYRLTAYQTESKTYMQHQPRIALRLMLSKQIAMKASGIRIGQNLHLLSNNGISLPSDLWVPVTARIKPIVSDQISLGLTYASNNRNYEVTVEGYYKTLSNIVEYKEGASFIDTSSTWEDKVAIGNGLSYGVELMIEKKSGKFHGWVSYTLSKTTRQVDGVSSGKLFPYKYDRPLNFSVTTIWEIRKNRKLNINWIYASGNPVTFAFENYISNTSDHYQLFQGGNVPNNIENYSLRNNYRFPTYHRLDVGYSIIKPKKWGSVELSFGLYNAYNRLNAFTINESDRKLYKTSLLPIVPSIQYTAKF